MSETIVCRICLNTNVKCYHYNRGNLKYCYEQIMASKVNEREPLPKWLCFECAALLLKFDQFRQKCISGQALLREIAWNGVISYEEIGKIDRHEKNLLSPLSATHADDCTKTYTEFPLPSVPYKKRNNIKNEHINHVAAHMTNTDDVNIDEASHDVLSIIQDNMSSTSHEFVKEETIPVDLDMMNTVVSHHIEHAEPVNEAIHTYPPNYVEPVNYHQQTIFNHENRNEADTVWLTDIPPSTTTSEDKKPCATKKSSFLDPLNWKRIMLTEEQAIEKFHKRATDPKYVNARYKCTDCLSNFARDEMLRKHYLINHVETLGPHICRFCKRRFHKPCKLRLHMKRHYVQIECLRCNMVFWGEGLAFQHEEFHRGVTTTCEFCNHQFRHKSTYYQHLRTHHRSSHVCALCGASFVSKAGLNVHKKRLHALDNKNVAKDANADIYCKRCDMKFASVSAYQEHYRHAALHADGIDITADMRGPSEAGRQTLPHVRCTVCHEQFYSYQACVKHHRHHHPSVAFMKKSVSYAGKSNERIHCEVCGAFIKVTSLYTHMNAHTRTKVYTCDVCRMQFNYPTSLLRHKVTHTGEKKHACPLCEKRFTQRNSMQLHYRTFHLKEPYPKRNRQKKKPQPQDIQMASVTTLLS